MGYFLRKYLTWEAGGEKKTKIFAAGQLAMGLWRMVMADGEGNGGGVAAEALVVVVVLNKSKIKCAPLSIVLFYVATNLFCTIAEFAPWPELAGMLEAGRLEGCQADGLAGRYPPCEVYSWDDKWF